MQLEAAIVTLDNILTMSSVEIAELTGKRHDNVMRDIKLMLEELGIGLLKFEETSLDVQGKQRKIYALPKRECLILVSGYSIKLRAVIVDRWQELEAQASKPRGPTTFLEAMELVVATERARLELECKVGAMMPVVAAHKRLTESEGTHEIRQAAKLLKLNPRELTEWLSENRWIYKHSRLSRWAAFQDKINEGLLMHRVNVVDLPQGGSVTSSQVRVTANGLATIAELTDCDFENGDLDSDPFGLAIV